MASRRVFVHAKMFSPRASVWGSGKICLDFLKFRVELSAFFETGGSNSATNRSQMSGNPV